MLRACLFATAVGFAPAAAAQSLSFADAVALSQQSPVVSARASASEAAQRQIGPAAAVPDPQLILSIENVPATGPDRFRLNRDEMTMQRVGVMQEMPSFADLSARRAMARAQANRAGVDLEIGRLEARLAAARAWLGLYYAQRRLALLEHLEQEARALSDTSRARLAAGATDVDDAVAAAIEATRLQDRRADATASVVTMRAELTRWIGASGSESLSADAPSFSVDAQLLRDQLRQRPALALYRAETDVAEADLGMARAERWPDWSWEVSYGRREPALEDMASVEVRMGLPLFQHWRQDPLVASRRANVARAEAEEEATLREHAAALESALAQYEALAANVARARETRVPLARQRADAAVGAFGAGNLGASQLIAARRDALEAELDLIDLEERFALLGATLTLQYVEVRP